MTEDERGAGWRLPGCVKDTQSVDSVWNLLRKPTIDGVMARDVRPVATSYGRLVESYRGDWFGGSPDVAQVFFGVMHAGAISAWHAHERTLDRIGIVTGTVRLVLYDARQGSPSYGKVDEFLLSEHRPAVVVIPPRVWHGVHNCGSRDAVLCNAVNIPYDYADPDHFRVPADSASIPYRFAGTDSR